MFPCYFKNFDFMSVIQTTGSNFVENLTYGGIKMTSINLPISPDLKAKMEKFKNIDWKEVARDAIVKKIKDLEFLENFTSDSEIDDQLAINLGRKVSENISKRHSSDG